MNSFLNRLLEAGEKKVRQVTQVLTISCHSWIVPRGKERQRLIHLDRRARSGDALESKIVRTNREFSPIIWFFKVQ